MFNEQKEVWFYVRFLGLRWLMSNFEPRNHDFLVLGESGQLLPTVQLMERPKQVDLADSLAQGISPTSLRVNTNWDQGRA